MVETRLSDRKFAALGELTKELWEQSADDSDVWLQHLARLILRNVCVRWFLSEESGAINLVLEEHMSNAEAFWAARKNDGSIAPLRSITYRKTSNGWEAVE